MFGSSLMGGPFVKLVGVETSNVVAKRAARPLGFVRGVAPLDGQQVALGPLQLCSLGGLFLGLFFVHACSVVFLARQATQLRTTKLSDYDHLRNSALAGAGCCH